jgi:Sec-independent protein translocase protein TatA
MFDFGIGSTELIVLGVIALIVIGPRDLPKVLRTLGQVMTKVQRACPRVPGAHRGSGEGHRPRRDQEGYLEGHQLLRVRHAG